MNDQVKLLWEQAAQRDDLWDQARYEKFAELIVRECADIATINQYQSYSAGHYVLKHFGVEE